MEKSAASYAIFKYLVYAHHGTLQWANRWLSRDKELCLYPFVEPLADLRCILWLVLICGRTMLWPLVSMLLAVWYVCLHAFFGSNYRCAGHAGTKHIPS